MPPVSDAVPMKFAQPAALYEPPFDGNDVVEAGAVASIVHVNDAGVASVLPAASVARTSKVCEPSARPLYDFGEEQVVQEPPSIRHANVDPLSLELKEKLAAPALVGSAGCAVIVVFGAAVSTVHVNEAGVASVLPAASVARASKVCE